PLLQERTLQPTKANQDLTSGLPGSYNSTDSYSGARSKASRTESQTRFRTSPAGPPKSDQIGKETIMRRILLPLLMVELLSASSGVLLAQSGTCNGMSVCQGASLNGFVP